FLPFFAGPRKNRRKRRSSTEKPKQITDDMTGTTPVRVETRTHEILPSRREPYSGQWRAKKPRKTQHDSRSIARSRAGSEGGIAAVRTLSAKSQQIARGVSRELTSERKEFFH